MSFLSLLIPAHSQNVFVFFHSGTHFIDLDIAKKLDFMVNKARLSSCCLNQVLNIWKLHLMFCSQVHLTYFFRSLKEFFFFELTCLKFMSTLMDSGISKKSLVYVSMHFKMKVSHPIVPLSHREIQRSEVIERFKGVKS